MTGHVVDADCNAVLKHLECNQSDVQSTCGAYLVHTICEQCGEGTFRYSVILINNMVLGNRFQIKLIKKLKATEMQPKGIS